MRRLSTVFILAISAATAFADDKPATAPAVAAGEAKGDGMHPRLKMETSLGDIILELDAVKAPITADNFIQYAEAGHYNGLIFHRIMPTFMIQGGGYTAEVKERKEGLRPGIKNEWTNGLKNVRGSIAMARLGGQPNSGTAQFFINVVDNAMLDTPRDGAGYAVFGKVVEGMDVVDKIKDVKTTAHAALPGMGAVVPVEPVIIKGVKLAGAYEKDKVKALMAEAEKAARKEVDAYIAKAEAETGKKFEKAPSGLMWIVMNEGAGDKKPTPTSTVEVHYTGWLIDGTQIDTSVGKEPATFLLTSVIRGWTDGVSMMKIGEKRKFVIPPDLAWAGRGFPPKVPPDAWVAFDIELLGIK
ncbi:Peptidyl-prolyl cis-trans isomerase A precursor [Phycisphaerae bacterium RAS1]|nr:Peptidyl-prolyl cis-trans isomerase A precursor [Phycisphaerae bacterium RAS1]